MSKLKLRHEITATIIIKLILLMTLWYCFFSTPVSHHLNSQLVFQHIIEGSDPHEHHP